MCLLIALFQVVPGVPLVVAANRDERYDRPAEAMTVLAERGPRILGGRDHLAGGTWLAVNEHGLVAGVTNQPSRDGRDPGKRSRGELPLAFARYEDAAAAVAAVTAELDPAAYNPGWMLVGDRHSLFSVALAGRGKPETEQLGPGLHILENAPLRSRSPKAALVRRLVHAEQGRHDGDPVAALAAVLRSHRPAVTGSRAADGGRSRPREVSAACVHTPGYGTRSALTVAVAADGVPAVRVADGPPCQSPFRDVTSQWADASGAFSDTA